MIVPAGWQIIGRGPMSGDCEHTMLTPVTRTERSNQSRLGVRSVRHSSSRLITITWEDLHREPRLSSSSSTQALPGIPSSEHTGVSSWVRVWTTTDPLRSPLSRWKQVGGLRLSFDIRDIVDSRKALSDAGVRIMHERGRGWERFRYTSAETAIRTFEVDENVCELGWHPFPFRRSLNLLLPSDHDLQG